MFNLNRLQRAFLFKAGFAFFSFAVFIFILFSLKALILPIIIGALLAYLFKPLLNSFRYPWIPEGARVTILIFGFTSIIFGMTWVIRQAIPTEVEKLELSVRMQYKFNEKIDSVLMLDKPKEERSFISIFLAKEMNPMIVDINKYLSLTQKQSEKFKEYYEEGLITEKYFEYYKKNKEHKNIIREIASQLPVEESKTSNDTNFKISHILNAFSIWIVMPLVFIFFLFDKGDILRYFIKFVPNKYFELTLTMVEEVDSAIGKYLRGTLLECACVGLTMFLGFYLIGLNIKASLFIGIIAGLTNAIPFVGTAVALIIGLAYGVVAEDVFPVLPFLTADDVLIGIIAVVMGAHLLDNAYFQPVIVGSAVSVHPLVVLIGIFGGSLMFGFAGILLAIPTIVIVKTTVETLYKGLKEYYII